MFHWIYATDEWFTDNKANYHFIDSSSIYMYLC